jgi:putative ABC transport system substrate-binding protein
MTVGRREFITLLGGAATWPLAASAQQRERMRRVGVLNGAAVESDPIVQTQIAVYREGLAKLGWVQDRNLRLDFRFGGGDGDRIRAYAAELVRLAPDAIVTGTRAATLGVQERTHTIPIIIVGAGDAATNGLVRNIARPEANITGVTNLFGSIGGKWVELLKEAVPTLNRVSFVESQFALEGGRLSSYRPSIEDASRALSVEMIDIQYRSPVQLVRAIDAFAARPNGGLIVGPATTRIDAGTILELAAQYRLPTIHATREFAENGGLISYGGNPLDAWGRAPFFVDRILRGAKVSELPVEFPTKFRLVVNLKAAKAIGLALPPTLLARADEVIE